MEHSKDFDERIKDYEFTPELFRSQMERYNSHQQEIKESFKLLFCKIDELKDRLSSLPCDKHEGERKVLEIKIQGVGWHLAGMWAVIGVVFMSVLLFGFKSLIH